MLTNIVACGSSISKVRPIVTCRQPSLDPSGRGSCDGHHQVVVTRTGNSAGGALGQMVEVNWLIRSFQITRDWSVAPDRLRFANCTPKVLVMFGSDLCKENAIGRLDRIPMNRNNVLNRVADAVPK
jgi:hypothetical protein